jgi:hypothetical protein
MIRTLDAKIDVLKADQNGDILEGDDPPAPIKQELINYFITPSYITIFRDSSIYQLQTPGKSVVSPNRLALQEWYR